MVVMVSVLMEMIGRVSDDECGGVLRKKSSPPLPRMKRMDGLIPDEISCVIRVHWGQSGQNWVLLHPHPHLSSSSSSLSHHQHPKQQGRQLDPLGIPSIPPPHLLLDQESRTYPGESAVGVKSGSGTKSSGGGTTAPRGQVVHMIILGETKCQNRPQIGNGDTMVYVPERMLRIYMIISYNHN
ncbi:hypothetical protein Tco_1081118 [Tanacetum coccineum]|uniref:Uncharacterized protein n=1 Tax=Tanacetum coccineum TaxID=301880 RepID=A0ABQ5HYM4_9ASTR